MYVVPVAPEIAEPFKNHWLPDAADDVNCAAFRVIVGVAGNEFTVTDVAVEESTQPFVVTTKRKDPDCFAK